jgi:hypothetical protein
MLRFIIGNVTDFEAIPIDISTERKSINGSRVLKHIELLTDAEFEAVRYNAAFEFKSDEAIAELMATEEWTVNSQ